LFVVVVVVVVVVVAVVVVVVVVVVAVVVVCAVVVVVFIVVVVVVTVVVVAVCAVVAVVVVVVAVVVVVDVVVVSLAWTSTYLVRRREYVGIFVVHSVFGYAMLVITVWTFSAFIWKRLFNLFKRTLDPYKIEILRVAARDTVGLYLGPDIAGIVSEYYT